jgi:hypothetical protein
MARVRTFSTQFPAYHPRAGQPTYFVEQIYNCIYSPRDWRDAPDVKFELDLYMGKVGIKRHTIRAGHHFKPGDYFSPRVWTGKPYASKQVQIAPDIQVVKTFDFKIVVEGDCIAVFIDNLPYFEENPPIAYSVYGSETLAGNDGLSLDDFKAWFNWGKKPFDGQIICWDESVEY